MLKNENNVSVDYKTVCPTCGQNGFIHITNGGRLILHTNFLHVVIYPKIGETVHWSGQRLVCVMCNTEILPNDMVVVNKIFLDYYPIHCNAGLDNLTYEERQLEFTDPKKYWHTFMKPYIEIDVELEGLVDELNACGFATSNCCAGHTPDESGYIAFIERGLNERKIRGILKKYGLKCIQRDTSDDFGDTYMFTSIGKDMTNEAHEGLSERQIKFFEENPDAMVLAVRAAEQWSDDPKARALASDLLEYWADNPEAWEQFQEASSKPVVMKND